MPFKLKLKKSRHYNVVSKSLFVISVEMLDSTNIECTLSSESLGQDCLDVVCQKLSLNQPKFFGLLYMSRVRDNLCWLELDKPIKRQLDKHARGLTVYLRVMYYVVSGVRLLNDEVTRYHYFLQLKMDVIEGRISCTPQQAVELASYCMQAEFGNFDAERHTAHYLKDFQLFPKTFTDVSLLETLTDAASRQHAVLQNLPQGTAEEYYICACQRLEGYGQELYSVKDRNGDAVTIGVSLTGIAVSYLNGQEGRSYGWIDISNVINHKRDFTIESVIGSEKADFQFPDAESAKNAWHFCVLQHMFYRQYEMMGANDQTDKNSPMIQRTHVEDNIRQIDSYEDITNVQNHWNPSNNPLQQRAQSTSCLDLNTPTDIDKLRSLLPSYRPAPDYETAVQQKYRNSSGAIQTREPLRTTRSILYSSQPEIHQNEAYTAHLRYPDVTHNNIEQKNLLSTIYNKWYPQIANENLADKMEMLHIYKPPPPYPSNRISSNSTPDLAGISQQKQLQHHFINNLVSGSSPDLVSSGNFLNPHYIQYATQQTQPVHRSQSYLPPQHGTYENLASMFNNNLLARPQAVILDNPNITKHIKKVYDEHGNVIYCMPANMKQILQETQLPTAGFVVARPPNDGAEPIYENIPLSWRNDNDEMRTRTQSIHSAPEISQVVNHTVVNAMQSHLNDLARGSRENVYANVNNRSLQSSRGELNVTNSSTNNLSDAASILNRSTSQNLIVEESSPGSNVTNSTFIINKSSPVSSAMNSMTNSRTNSSTVLNVSSQNLSVNRSASPKTMSRTNTYVISKNSGLSDSGNGTAETDVSSASSGSHKPRRKIWGMLMGRSKSSEKVKSATLGREKEKNKERNQANVKYHRWSTGLPRFHPLPPSISKETMCQLLENKLADSQLFFEFDKIPKKKQNGDFTTASLPENTIFNHYKDVLPYEDNRLRLTPTRDNKYGYINASHITATVGSKQRFYIAAQGPFRLTLPYFWQCVWEAEVYLLVQLTDQSENFVYLPEARERCIDIGQDYQIWWEFSQQTGHCVTSKVRLCHVASRRYRTLWHLHYTDWGDQGCPHSVAHFLGFLEELQSVQQHSMVEIPPGHNKNPPVLVHCTAGVGRTGLTILSDLLLYTVDHNQEVDIPRVVGLLRHQRAYMVQTIAQYRFVYSLLIHYLKQTRLI